MKICSKCGNKFEEHSSSNYWCKPCMKEAQAVWYQRNKEKRQIYNKEWSDKNKEKTRIRALKRVYSISEEEVADRMNKQSGCCEICKDSLINSLGSFNYCVDHNHESLEVRGLLCKACNSALGLLKEDIGIIESLTEYIKKYNG